MKKILIIEDNDDIRNNTAEILELSNYKVIVAENGKKGLEKAILHAPDLIICDIMMPELDGYGVLHACCKNESTKNTPFIFLTAKSEKNDFRKGMELGADDYITKPFTGTDLLNAVDSRLKKIDLLKQHFTPDWKGVQNLVKASFEDNLQSIAENREVSDYKRKQIVYKEGNRPYQLFYIIKGKVKTFKTNDDGKNLIIDLFNVGDFFGYTALLEQTVYKETAEALEDTELAIIPKEDFENLLNKNNAVAKKFIQMLAKNISTKEEHLLGLAYNSLRKKVAEALMILYKKYNHNNEQKFTIDISRENLATIAGTATESLIRTLSDFRNEKLIDIQNSGIKILDEKKLANLLN